jgi:hypothetical protein
MVMALPGQGYNYSSGDDRGQFLDKNAWRDPSPIGAVKGWMWYNKHSNRDDLKRLMEQQNAGRQGLYDARGQLLDQMRGQQDQARTLALTNLGQSYGNREGTYQQAYSARLNDALGGAQQQYNQGMQSSSLGLAARGQLGGSSDYENQARQRNQLNQAIMGGQSEASQYAQGLRDSDYQQMDATRRSLLAGDPQSAAAFQAMASNAASQGERYGDMASLAQRSALLRQMGSNNLSQLGGNLGQTGAYYVQSGNYGSWPQYGGMNYTNGQLNYNQPAGPAG